MDDRPIHDREIYEAMEVCRPQSDDVSDPSIAFLAAELAAHPDLDERYEQLQRLDARIAAAFGAVAVPASLADRIIARFALSQVDEPPAVAEPENAKPETTAAGSQPMAATAKIRRTAITRRWMWAALCGVATAASILLVVLADLPGDSPITKDSLVMTATDLFATSLHHEPQGFLVHEKHPPNAYPFSPDLTPPPAMRWHWVDGFLGLQAVAYDMVDRNGTRATLYVVEATIAGLPASPDNPERSAATEQFSVGTWQSGRLLYVLVVNGGTGAYRGLLNSMQGVVT